MELRSRIEIARSAFLNMKHFFCNRSLNKTFKISVLKLYVFSILLYGIEATTFNKASIKKMYIEAFEM